MRCEWCMGLCGDDCAHYPRVMMYYIGETGEPVFMGGVYKECDGAALSLLRLLFILPFQLLARLLHYWAY